MKRTIIYGDIHGCLEEFEMLRNELNITQSDREILVGDLLDRGPYSNETLTYARENNLELVLGNHEYKYIRYHRHLQIEKETGKKNPMKLNPEKLSIYENISDIDMEYLYNAPFFLRIDNTTIIHAGISNKIELENATKKELEMLTRIRTLDPNNDPIALGQKSFGAEFWSEIYTGHEGVIVYGHEVFDKVKIDRHAFGIDTGCVYGGKLTALIIHDTKDPIYNYDILQIQAFKKYSEKKETVHDM